MWSWIVKVIGLDLVKWVVSEVLQWAKKRLAEHQEKKESDNIANEIQKLSEALRSLRLQKQSEKRDAEIQRLEMLLRAALKRQHFG